ncbi:hypothetical protein [Paenibacillus sp. FSL L8-0708]|uniref:hypothetical protein n=1 Tax=Paenibacillus sp. FSL L8-0708 TaxID=2975311 RepID=UPI0030FB60C6
MIQMFPAAPNSPATELSAAITDIQTTITLLDASKLPDAPNIATIGVDESAETVRYEGKSGNDLTGVTRGFSGTVAKAWAVGVGVARYFTAYDADALRENVAEHSAQLADTTQEIVSLSSHIDTQLATKATKAELISGLAPKADQSYVDTQFANIVSGAPKGTYTTLSALQAALPTGAEGTFLVLEDGKWYFWNGTAWASGGVYQSTKIPDGGVDYIKLDINPVVGVTGINLFNRLRVTKGHYVSPDNGLLIAASGFVTSDYINILSNTAYHKNTYNMLAFYDVHKVFISGIPNGDNYAFVTPSNAAFLRMTVATSVIDTAQLELGSVETAYEDGAPRIKAAQIKDLESIYTGISKVFAWREVSVLDTNVIDLGIKPVFQSYKTGKYIFFDISGAGPHISLMDGHHLVLEWDENKAITETAGYSRLRVVPVGSDLPVNYHVIASNIVDVLTSPIPSIQQAIYKFHNPFPALRTTEIFAWRDATITDVNVISLGLKPVFQSYSTSEFCYFNNEEHNFTYSVPDGQHLVLNWVDTSTVTETTDVSRLQLIPINSDLSSDYHVIATYVGGVLTSPIPSIQQAIYKFRNPFPDIVEKVRPLTISKNLRSMAPLYFRKHKKQIEDVVVLLMGDSISTTNHYTTPRTDAMFRPPLMVEHAYVTNIEEQLRWDGQRYYRYDTGIFTETSSTAVTKDYDLAWDWVGTTEANLYAINNRPALTRILEGTNAKVSYTVPSGVKRCDFIYRTDYLNAATATVTVSSGNEVLQVYNESSSAWVEANGYSYSAKEVDELLPGNLRRSAYQKRLKMKVVGALGTTIVTITNNGSGRLTYWGIQTGIREFMHDFILSSRGGHSIARLENFEAWDVDYYKPNLILWELPILNENMDVANADYSPKNMGAATTINFATRFLTKANQLKSKTYTPELISWVMFFGTGNNAIDGNNNWAYGVCDNGERVSVPNYISRTISEFDENNLYLIDLFSLYMDYARKRSVSEGGSIRDIVLSGTGVAGSSLTIDGGHFNDLGAAITTEMFGSFFLQ